MGYSDDGRLETLNGHADGLSGNAPKGGALASEPAHLMFDFTDADSVDLSNLSLVFTARELLPRSDRVWVTGLPQRFWSFLRSMGLEGYFEQFPGPGAGQA